MTVLEIAKTPKLKPQYRDKYVKPNYIIDKIDLEFDIQQNFTVVTSVMHIERMVEESHPLILDGANLELLEIKLNGKQLSEKNYFIRQYTDNPENITDVTVVNQQLVVEKVPNNFILETKVKIFPSKNKTCMGLYETDGHLTTQCESEGFRKITFFIDRPDNRSVFTTKILADKNQYPVILSNGNLQEAGSLDKERHYAIWHDPHVKPGYLFALVASNMQCIEDHFVTKSGEQVILKVYVPAKDINKVSFAMEALKDSMKFDEEVYNREYDLNIYNVVGIPNFNMGAMENKGLNIFNTSALLVEPNTGTDNDHKRVLTVVSHEYFHNWAGNRVGPLSWFELSLKEGLATAKEREFSRFKNKSVVSRIEDVETLQIVQFAQDAGPMAQPVRLLEILAPENAYTTTTYYKGAELLHMLKILLGKDIYHKGVSHYFDKYDGQAVTINEFLTALEEVSGKNLAQFLTWYHQSGTPILDFAEEYDSENKKYHLTITQNNLPTKDQSKKQNLLIPVMVALIDSSGKAMDLGGVKEKVLELVDTTQTFTFENVLSKPTVSVLRDFSAPVKIGKTPLTDKDWLFLAEHDTDEMNQWLAFRKVMLQEAKNLLNGDKVSLQFLDVCKSILSNDKIESGLKANMLFPVNFNDLLNRVENANPRELKKVIEALSDAIAKHCAQELLVDYTALKKETLGEPQFISELAGKRSLKNLCLTYIGRLKTKEGLELAKEQLDFSDNMTDILGSLSPILRSYSDEYSEFSQECLNNFYNKWKKEDLVVLKWLQLNNLVDLIDKPNNIRKLMEHEAFDIQNPNKVRALIGGFANSYDFHDEDGMGYKLLVEIIEKIDKFNPMLAAGLMTPLTKWEKFSSPFKDMMRDSLEELSGKVSHNVQEFIDKSIAVDETEKKNDF